LWANQFLQANVRINPQPRLRPLAFPHSSRLLLTVIVLLDTKLSEILRHSPKKPPVRKMETTWSTHTHTHTHTHRKKEMRS